MPRIISLVPVILSSLTFTLAGPQAPASAQATTTFHSVVYFEVRNTTAARTVAKTALNIYAANLRTQDGFVDFEPFEQTGRPGHFVFVEAWRDQSAFDKRATGFTKQFTDALESIRISDIDRRPYKVLSVAARARTSGDTVYVVTHVDASPVGQVPMMLQRLAEDSRRDDGNLRFDIYQHTMRANHFTIIEAWRNRQALDAHAGSAHTRQYRDAFGPLAGSPLDERLFESVTP
jgi:quinol monooxygenase YgiN